MSSSIEPVFKGLGSHHAYPQILIVLTLLGLSLHMLGLSLHMLGLSLHMLGLSLHKLGKCQSDMRKRPINIHSRLEVENVAPIKSRALGTADH